MELGNELRVTGGIEIERADFFVIASVLRPLTPTNAATIAELRSVFSAAGARVNGFNHRVIFARKRLVSDFTRPKPLLALLFLQSLRFFRNVQRIFLHESVS